ncbi:hypothetical protein HBA55_30710 [Pseudomaricurvus alkylphenolicus]|jgi:uncharacterized protein YqgV (UPF0045/DUF77 family)|uniref:YkoF family thiamine/hydroxymethylpyrimidine-binding protein n=1 Tax=Pseudomaricurvus alkylphenolicus TaxID=1306991 RepID=UPI0014240E03|nr:YkoF family thiamine/hydroxymethylpyrimidine-binding protein [Pseudomaricurvus alkylphenolicus]NIB44014.1 hypothetical protein [Pseudomaricurvus alkylphenolicus]
MQVSIDISLYPNNEDFIPPILDFIEHLNGYDNIQIQTFPTSTVVMGDFDEVMDILKTEIKAYREKHGMGVFVTKILPGYGALKPQEDKVDS